MGLLFPRTSVLKAGAPVSFAVGIVVSLQSLAGESVSQSVRPSIPSGTSLTTWQKAQALLLLPLCLGVGLPPGPGQRREQVWQVQSKS